MRRLTEIGITKEKVMGTILRPDRVELSYYGRKIAQSALPDTLVLESCLRKEIRTSLS